VTQVVADFHADAELTRGRRRNLDLGHFPGVETGDADDRSAFQLAEAAELRIQRRTILEQHPSRSDHEERRREQDDAEDHEQAGADST
jgi:hypothetical protein